MVLARENEWDDDYPNAFLTIAKKKIKLKMQSVSKSSAPGALNVTNVCIQRQSNHFV